MSLILILLVNRLGQESVVQEMKTASDLPNTTLELPGFCKLIGVASDEPAAASLFSVFDKVRDQFLLIIIKYIMWDIFYVAKLCSPN